MGIRLIIFLLLLNFSLQAQQLCPCCTASYNEFSFWIGEWEVSDSLGNVLGTNTIAAIEKNCAITENWKSSKQNTGTSLNFYNKVDKTWNQIWVDNTGYVLKLKGAFQDGVMVLRSNLLEGQNQIKYYNQISWTPQEDGSVIQVWEIFDDKDELLSTAFKGFYKPKIK